MRSELKETLRSEQRHWILSPALYLTVPKSRFQLYIFFHVHVMSDRHLFVPAGALPCPFTPIREKKLSPTRAATLSNCRGYGGEVVSLPFVNGKAYIHPPKS